MKEMFPFTQQSNQLMFNIITNVVHPKEIYPNVLSVPKRGEELYKEFCKERLCENSTIRPLYAGR